MSRLRSFVVAILLVCSVFTLQAQDHPTGKQEQKVALILALLEGTCPGMLKPELAKNPNLAALGAPVIENVTADTCGCFVDELRTMPTAEVTALLDDKTRASEMEQMAGRCTVRSLKPHVGAMCMGHARESEVEDAQSRTLCDCVQTRMNESDDVTLMGLIANEDEKGFEALMAECKVE